MLYIQVAFDPVTYGHFRYYRESCKKVDNLIVAVLNNPSKKNTFSLEERIDFTKRGYKGISQCYNRFIFRTSQTML